MAPQSDNAGRHGSQDNYSLNEEPEPGLLHIVRLLYQRRVKLAILFVVIFVLGVILFAFNYFHSTPSIRGIIGLNFRGIEKSEYPSGNRFSVEDFRSADLLTKALADADLAREGISVTDLAAHININPSIPAEIQSRWRKQDRDGARREEYYPNEFSVGIELGKLPNPQGRRLFDALIRCYRDRVKYDQTSVLGFAASWNSSYEKLADHYDYWDIPQLFRDSYILLSTRLTHLIAESLQYQDPKYQLLFREIDRDLETWEQTRLQSLEAVTCQGQPVRNRDVVMQRIRYRLQELDIRIRQQSQEATEAMHLLEVIERPQALLAGQFSGRDALPLIDADLTDKLIKSDYVGPVVQRISTLQNGIQNLEAERSRLQLQLGWLPRSSTESRLPPGFSELVESLSAELASIIKEYNRILDEYLDRTISSLVIVKQSPLSVRDAYPVALAIPVIAFISFVVALFFTGMGRQLEKAGEEKQPPGHDGSEPQH